MKTQLNKHHFLPSRKHVLGLVLIVLILMSNVAYTQTYQVNGTAVNNGGGLVRLTAQGIGNQVGTAWSTTKINLTQPYDMTFDMFFGCDNAANGGDGMTFTLHNDTRGLAAQGEGFGYLGYGGAGAISPSIAIEFDTYDGTASGGLNELVDDHIAIDINGNVNNTGNTFAGTSGSATVQKTLSGRDLESCAANANNYYTIRVVWNPTAKTLQLYEEGVLTMTYTSDIINTVFGGTTNVYWGFTGATGSASNEQWIAPTGSIIPWQCSAATTCCTSYSVTKTGPSTVCSSPITLGLSSAYTQYLWSTGATTSTINVSTPGTYSLTVMQTQSPSGTLCPNTATYTIATSGPTASLSGGGTICNDGTTTSPVSVALTGTSPWKLTYAIDGVAQPTITGITTSPYIINGKSIHTYSISSVTDNLSCAGAVSGTAVIGAFPDLPVGHDVTFAVSGTRPTLSVDNLGGTYKWYDTGGSLVYTGTNFLTPPLSATTTYFVENTALSASVTKSLSFLNNTKFGTSGNNTQTNTGLDKLSNFVTFTANSSFTLNSVTADVFIKVSPQPAGTKITVYLDDLTNGALSTSVSVPLSGFAANTTQSILVPFTSFNIISGHSYKMSYEGQLPGNAQGIMYWDFVGPRGNYPAGVVAVITKDPEVTITAPNQGWYPGLFNWQITTGSPGSSCGRTPVKAIYDITLPISMLSFTATLQRHGTVLLNWSTANENNNDYFTVQRSIDGINFVDIAVVKGAGTSKSILNYASIDNEASSGISYYRIKQTDFNGKSSYSSIVSINDRMSNGDFTLFPNPVAAGSTVNCHITGANPEEETSLVIYDVLGREIYTTLLLSDEAGNINQELNIMGLLKQGTYVVTISLANKEYKQKFMVF